MPPWDKYQTQTAAGPWAKYGAEEQPVQPLAEPQPAQTRPSGTRSLTDLIRAESGLGPAAPAAPTAPVVEPSWTDTIMDGASYAGGLLDQAGRGAATGVTNILGLPNALQQGGLSVLEWGLDKAGAPQGVQDTVSDFKSAIDIYPSAKGMQGGLDTLNNMTADTLGVERPRTEPENLGERVVNRVGEELGAMAVPAGAIVAKARTMTPAAANAGNWFSRTFLAPAAISPGKFLGKEVGYGATAGLGAATANELTQGRDSTLGQLGDIAGSLLGAGAYGLAGRIASGVRELGAAATNSNSYASRVVRENVADKLIENSDIMGRKIDPANIDQPLDTTELIDAISRPTRAESIIPGFQASTADRAGDTGLASLENSRSAVTGRGKAYSSRLTANSNAVEGVLDRMSPDVNPGVFREAAEAERQRRIAEATGEADIARIAFDDAVASAQPVLSESAARGSNLRGALQDARDRASAGVDELYAPINASTARVDIAPLRERFAGTIDELPLNDRQRFLPAEANVPQMLAPPVQAAPIDTGLLDVAGNPITRQAPAPDTTVPLNEVTSVRSGLTDDIRAANATPGRAQQARVANQFRQQTDEYMDAILPPELRGQLDTARAARRDVADRFERPGTGIAETLRSREGGGYALNDNAVTQRFTPTDQGNISDFQALLREAGSDSRVRNAIADEILTTVRRNGLADKPEQLTKFLNDRNVVLAEFPELRERLGNLGVRRATLTAAQRNAEKTAKDLNTPGRSAAASYLQYGDVQSEEAISGVLRSADSAKATDELMSFVGNDPKAVEGLKASFWQKLDSESRSRNMLAETEGGTRPIIPQRMLRFLDDPKNAAVAEKLYADNPEHLQDIRAIGEALRGVNLEQRVGKSTNPSGTAQMMRGQPTISAAEGASKFYNYRAGRISLSTLVLSIGQKVARTAVGRQREAAFGRLLDEALLNPKIAAGLLAENNPANRAALARSAKGWLGNEAATFTKLLNEDEEDEDTRAIMGEN